jgi:iron complex transport system substrate-binding protein
MPEWQRDYQFSVARRKEMLKQSVDEHKKARNVGGHPRSATTGNKRPWNATQNAISSRYFILLALLVLTLAAACSPQGGEPAAPPAATDAPTEPTAEAVAEPTEAPAAESTAETSGEETAETRTFTDAMGREVAIPVDPQRIVVLSEIDLDSLLALGIVPVGAPFGRGQTTLPSYLLSQIEGQTTPIGPIGEPDLETILTLEPDLIVYSDPYGPLAERIPELEQIAPTVVPYVDTGDWHWKSVFNAIAAALDKTAEAEAWMATYDEQTATLGSQLSDDMREVSIVRWMADGPRILLSNAFSSQVLSDVGFTRPQYQLDLAGSHPVHTDVISMEQIDLVNADVIFAGGLNPEGDVALQEALENPLVQALPAVQANRLFVVDGLAWSSTGGPMAATQVLADVEGNLAN